MISWPLAHSLVFCGIATAAHVAFFVLESVVWSRPGVWRIFGIRSQMDADVTRPMALNQGFYNLFLAIGALLGIVLVLVPGARPAGITLMFFSMSSMLLAAVVLLATSRRLWRGAALQGLPPLVGICLLLLALLTQVPVVVLT